MAQPVQLVVFDLDGTLVDSRHDIAAAANDMIRSFGGTPLPEDEIATMVGEGAGLLARRALRAAGLDRPTPEALERYLSAYDARLLDTTVLYPGMRATLDALAPRLPLAVLTNKPEGATRKLLHGLGVAPLFMRTVGGDTSLGRKPAPAGLLDVVAAAGATAAGTLMVGDSPIDLQTARAAGTRICLARYGFGFRFDAAGFSGDELFIDRPSQLVAVVNGSASAITPEG
jgi:phosphoglycolate phosphatase